MYMMVRQKLAAITDLQLLQFMTDKGDRCTFLADAGLLFHEQEQVLGVGFHIRDRAIEYSEADGKIEMDKGLPFLLDVYRAYKILCKENVSEVKDLDLLREFITEAKFNSRPPFIVGVHFLNAYKGRVMAETIYTY